MCTNVAELRRQLETPRREGRRIGLVPTMGALHAGHLSLMSTARKNCDVTVVTIFVNPTQFAPHEDLAKYPRPWETDRAACQQMGVDVIFRPEVAEIYPQPFFTTVEVQGLSEVLEGAHRPGHFRGVTTVVLKLFNMVQPHVAYFGQKDFQQQLLIRRMTLDVNLPIEIVTCPTVREPDGLALSSRNVYLSADERRQALALSHCLKQAEASLLRGMTDVAAIRQQMLGILRQHPHVVPDYATVVDPVTLQDIARPQPQQVAIVAARVGTTRLIDNLPIDL